MIFLCGALLLIVCFSRLDLFLLVTVAFCSWFLFALYGQELTSFQTLFSLVVTGAVYPLSVYGTAALIERMTGLAFVRPCVAPLVLTLASYHLFASGMIVDLLAADIFALHSEKGVTLSTIIMKCGSLLKSAFLISLLFAHIWLLIEVPLRLTARVAGVQFHADWSPYRLLVALSFSFLLSTLISDWLRAAL